MAVVMPKRRVPGHLNRRPRRRDDARPNLPSAPPPLDPTRDAAAAPEAVGAPVPAPTPGGRPPRPTQRLGGASRFVRSAAPPPEVQVDYRYVMADLRQLCTWAALAFVILLGLTLVIR
jgi:hypothetical protein